MFDPSARLWPASFKGVPFRVDSDTIEDGRRLVVHEFPNRDDPFVEDLGRKAGSFSVTAYVVGEGWGDEASALRTLAAQRGAGLLVLPLDGGLSVKLHEIKRAFAKDKLGFVAFDLSFVREGAQSALASVLSLAQLVFDAVDGLAAVLSSGWAVADDETQAALVDIPVALEAIRADRTVEPVASEATLRSLSGLVTAPPTGEASAWIAAAVDTARALGDALDPETAETAFSEAAADFASAQATAPVMRARRLARAVFVGVRAEAAARRVFADRPSAVRARAALVSAFEAELDAAAAAADGDLYAALGAAREAALRWFAGTILDLRPVVIARLPRSLPAHVVAWRLYGALDRLDDLIGRNQLKHPGFMPETIEAIAP